MKRFLEQIGRMVNNGSWKDVEERLGYADIKANPAVFVGSNFLAALVFTLIIGFFLLFKFNFTYAVLGSAFFVFIYSIIINSIVSLIADQRAKYIETFLPDVLLLMSSNLRSGITPEEAFLLSARPEFGFLSDKIKEAGKRLATGSTIQEAFNHLKSGISSKLFDQTISLIIEGLDSGGEIAVLLETTANDIKDMEAIRKEVNAMIFVYALFIFIAACMIAPVLYAVSIQLAGVLSKLSQSIAIQFVTEKAQVLRLVPTGISEDFLLNFTYVNLIITTAFSSLIVALINRGDEKYGLRYVPFFIGLTLILFFIARFALNAFFGGIKVL